MCICVDVYVDVDVPRPLVLRMPGSEEPCRSFGVHRELGCLLSGCFVDLVSRLSNGPYGASYGFLWGLIGDTK